MWLITEKEAINSVAVLAGKEAWLIVPQSVKTSTVKSDCCTRNIDIKREKRLLHEEYRHQA